MYMNIHFHPPCTVLRRLRYSYGYSPRNTAFPWCSISILWFKLKPLTYQTTRISNNQEALSSPKALAHTNNKIPPDFKSAPSSESFSRKFTFSRFGTTLGTFVISSITSRAQQGRFKGGGAVWVSAFSGWQFSWLFEVPVWYVEKGLSLNDFFQLLVEIVTFHNKNDNWLLRLL